MALDLFHPVIRDWFAARFGQPTEPQRRGWPHIVAGKNTLIAAPTGSGKTLAAFLSCLDRLVREGLAGTLDDRTRVLYVSPLKALSNDIRRNLETPLAELRAAADVAGQTLPEIRAVVRTGDTPASERQAMLKRPPHILVTTPESLYLLLTSERGRELLRPVQTVIVDEIHALARDKRGSHLALSLERLATLCDQPPVRIGLSATQRPIEEIGQFLVGTGAPPEIVDAGHLRELDLDLELPASELAAVCSYEQWGEVYERLVQMISLHRSTLVFVNTRRMAERIAHGLTELLGADAVASHHGSLSRQIRLNAEERLKNGQLRAIVATASLEMGIDVGFIDLVCQIGSPRSIATFLQRVGRSGHSLGVIPKGRLFPLTRDELLECLALVRAVKGGRLDKVEIPTKPLDILAQQIVAAVAAEDMQEADLFETFRRAYPYRDLARPEFEEVVKMVSDGAAPSLRRGAYLHRDAINGGLKARKGARITAVTCGGAIPDMADYRVVLEGDRTFVGTVNEDFAIESMAGDVFILGNTSWRIRNVRGLEVVVTDAGAAPATIPFWLGEAPGRTWELSREVSELREELAAEVQARGGPAAFGENAEAALAEQSPARELLTAQYQALRYVAAQVAAMGMVPTCQKIIFERFFDEAGGMQLVIHSPYGARVNKAWGLTLRKRFCRSFDFELQAQADDDGIVLSLSPQHSFPLEDLFKMLNPGNAEHLLKQALLVAPVFQTRWRWNATRALQVLRQNSGKKVPPNILRFRSEDLLAAVFPQTVGCLENHHGDVEFPDHPLVRQTVDDCLHEALDIAGFLKLLEAQQAGNVGFIGIETREPSPFSHELLNANPYAFLDGAPLEERRARAVQTRRSLSVEAFRDLSQLDPAAIDQVRREAWPVVRDVDELHDALANSVAIAESEAFGRADVSSVEPGEPPAKSAEQDWRRYFKQLCNAGRAARIIRANQPTLWAAAENWPLLRAAFPEAKAEPAIQLPPQLERECTASKAWVAMVRGRMPCVGPVTAAKIAADLGLEVGSVDAGLMALEAEGGVIRGRFGATPVAAPVAADGEQAQQAAPVTPIEWCDRRLLARIHRLTLDGLRRQIEPVDPDVFLRFLMRYQRVLPPHRWQGVNGLAEAIEQLQGFELSAGVWEDFVLAARVADYEPSWLDQLALTGDLAWGRLRPPKRDEEDGPSAAGLTRTAPIALVHRSDLGWLLPAGRTPATFAMRANARTVHEALSARGALFLAELRAITGLLPAHLEEALQELAALGLVSADGFGAVRSVVAPDRHHDRTRRVGQRMSRAERIRRAGITPKRRGASQLNLLGGNVGLGTGRWSLFPGPVSEPSADERLDRWAWQLLRRYGVVFRDLLTRESAAPAWGELAPLWRRMELRGEIRGGRFVRGVAGEQFATSEAVDLLRSFRDAPATKDWAVISAGDPLNLIGIVTMGSRIPATHANRLALCDGRLVASLVSGRLEFHSDVSADMLANITRALRAGLAAANRPARQQRWMTGP